MEPTRPEPTLNEAEIRRGVNRWAVKNLIFLVIMGTAVFISAGDLAWVWGWIYLGLVAAVLALDAAVLLARNPELLAERSQVQPGTQPGDRLLASVVALWGPLAIVVVSGLDYRLGWSQDFPLIARALGAVLALLGSLLSLWAMSANRFFSGTVRIQTERGHRTVREGPYRVLRHPGYLGAIWYYLAVPMVLGSAWAFAPALLTVGVVAYRTAREDRVLQEQLPGYKQYAQEVRFRLWPGLW